MDLKEIDEAIIYLRRGKDSQLFLNALLSSERYEGYDIRNELMIFGSHPLHELIKLDNDELMFKYLNMETKSYQTYLKQLMKVSGEMIRIFAKEN